MTFAHIVAVKAKAELQIAEESRRRKDTVVDSLLHGLQSLLPHVKRAVLQQQVIDLLGVQKQIETIDDLKVVLNEACTLSNRVRLFCNSAWTRPGLGWRIVYLFAAVFIVPWVTVLVACHLPMIKEQMYGIGRIIAGLLTGLPAIIMWVRPIVADANHRLKEIEGLKKQAEIAQEKAVETGAVIDAKLNVRMAAAKEESAKLKLAEAEAVERQLREEARTLAPERRLGRFIEERAQSLDYRGRLGLVSLARRDFQEMSDLFADTDALKRRLTQMRATKAKLSENEAEEVEIAANQLEELSKSIDRIVLFVDDLDRCQPEKVVDVLQAVHLLLAFPLFAVVVGVDQRCLRQSLRTRFKGLLTDVEESVESPMRESVQRKALLMNEERPATPLDYLEKIFHVPFHLPDMGEKGFGQLMHRLTESPPSESLAFASDADTHRGEPPALSAKDKEVANDRGEKKPDDEEQSKEGTETAEQDMETAPVIDDQIAEIAPAIRVIGSVPLQQWERNALRDYHPLIRTPRGATRLLNTYRLLRAGIPYEEWLSFRGDGIMNGEFRVVMLLLAAAAGYPAVAREWFSILRAANSDALFISEDTEGSDPIAWKQFKRVYDATFEGTMPKPSKDLFCKWLDLVERFAF